MEDIKEGNISGLTVEKADGQEPVAEKADAKEPAAEKADTLEPYVDRAAFDMVKKKKHIFRNAVVIAAAVLLLGYGVMTFLAYRYFPMGIRINGKDYSFRSYEDTLKELDAPYQDYELKLHFRNGDVTLSSEDMGFKATVEEDLKALRDDINPFFHIPNPLIFYHKRMKTASGDRANALAAAQIDCFRKPLPSFPPVYVKLYSRHIPAH